MLKQYKYDLIGEIELPEQTLTGKKIQMCMQADQTEELWKGFMQELMPQRKGVRPEELFSVELFPEGLSIKDFDAQTTFEKWAAIHVSDKPDGMELDSIVIPAGKYVKLVYKGSVGYYHQFAAELFGEVLPGMGLEVADRPHFNIMTPKYRGMDYASEEEVYVPVK